MSLSRPNDPGKRPEKIPKVPGNLIPVEQPVQGPEPKPPVVTTPGHSDQPTKKKKEEEGS